MVIQTLGCSYLYRCAACSMIYSGVISLREIPARGIERALWSIEISKRNLRSTKVDEKLTMLTTAWCGYKQGVVMTGLFHFVGH